MTYGRKVCNTLKEIRQQIAAQNEIEYTTSECPVEEECSGTCPKCESEVKYLENELNKRRLLGKAVAVAGISLGIASIFPACKSNRKIVTFGCPRFFNEKKSDAFLEDYFIRQNTFQIKEDENEKKIVSLHLNYNNMIYGNTFNVLRHNYLNIFQ